MERQRPRVLSLWEHPFPYLRAMLKFYRLGLRAGAGPLGAALAAFRCMHVTNAFVRKLRKERDLA
jgi:hypothetical protein